MAGQKKIPMRMCVGCHEMKPKKELLRVVRQDGTCRLDATGKASGRGAYVCPDMACLKKAQKSKAIERALECAIEAEVYDQLSAQMQEALSE